MVACIEGLHAFLTGYIVISAIFVAPGMVISVVTFLHFAYQWHIIILF